MQESGSQPGVFSLLEGVRGLRYSDLLCTRYWVLGKSYYLFTLLTLVRGNNNNNQHTSSSSSLTPPQLLQPSNLQVSLMGVRLPVLAGQKQLDPARDAALRCAIWSNL